MPYISLYSCIRNYCLEVLLLAKCPFFPSGIKYFASWVYMVNNMLLLGMKFVPSTPEVDYFKSRKTSSRCCACFEQRTGRNAARFYT